MAEIKTEEKVRTIEQTSKKFKSLILLGWAMFIGGIVMIYNAPSPQTGQQVSAVPGFIILGGIVTWIYAKFMIWWHHK